MNERYGWWAALLRERPRSAAMMVLGGPLLLAAASAYVVNDRRDATAVVAGAVAGLSFGAATFFAKNVFAALTLSTVGMLAVPLGLLSVVGVLDAAVGFAAWGFISTELFAEYGLATIAARRR